MQKMFRIDVSTSVAEPSDVYIEYVARVAPPKEPFDFKFDFKFDPFDSFDGPDRPPRGGTSYDLIFDDPALWGGQDGK